VHENYVVHFLVGLLTRGIASRSNAGVIQSVATEKFRNGTCPLDFSYNGVMNVVRIFLNKSVAVNEVALYRAGLMYHDG